MKLTALKVDPEFQGKIPPLTFEELEQLEKNIVNDGKVINPIIVWNGLIVDGHNRYAILQKHPDISYTVHEKEFADRFEVIIWICKNQLGRRNLSPEQKNYLLGKQYEAEKVAHGGDRKSADAKSSYHNDNLISGEKTCDRIAKENGVNRITVIRAEKFANCVDEAEKISPGSRQKILSGTVKGTAKDIMSLARTPPEERSALVEKICMPKEPKKSTNKSSSTTKKKKAKKKQPDAVEELSCSVETIPAVIEEPPKPQKALTELQTIRVLSNKMESVEQVADAEGMLSEVESAADAMIYRLDVCFEHYPEFLKNPNIRQKVVELYLPNAINRTIRSICADYNKEEESKAKEENRDPVLLPKFSCHILRHTFCTRFCENETNLKVIQEIMGHADISTTMDVYAEATQEKKKESMTSLQSALLVR